MAKNFDNVLGLSDEEAEFEALLAETGADRPGARVTRGDTVSGVILSMSGDSAFIDLGGKAEGILDIGELEDLEVGVGDTIEAIVLSTGSEIRLSRRLASGARDSQLVADAHEMGLPVEARLTGRNKGGFEVTVGGQSGFMPISQLDIGSVEESALDDWIGRTVTVLVQEYNPGARKLVVSRAQVLRKEREEKAEQLWAKVAVGQAYTGTVRSVQDYGCFVDLGGVDGLVHVREMSWTRVSHPSELVSTGDEVRVSVLEVDMERRRLGLSMKSQDADPYRELNETVNEGDTLDGVVSRLERYGAFVEILAGVEGLVHVSEITHLQRVHHPRDVLKEGEKVRVKVIQLDHPRRRISLSIKQVEGDPWSEVEKEFPIGTKVTGTVEKTAPFGVFVQVAPGVTALLPGSETGQASNTDLSRAYKPGETLTATVLSVDTAARRMSLSVRAGEDAAEAKNVNDWQKSNRGGSGMGTFAELLGNVKLDD
jgi:small subunit ribosomal protein S1